MRPFQGGGEMIFEVTEDNVTYNDPPHRFEAGTPPIVQAIGLGAALDYMEAVGRERDRRARGRAQGLCARAAARDQLAAHLRRCAGQGRDHLLRARRASMPHDVSMVIDRAGVAVRAGTHCAQPLLQRFGVTSTCRASFGMYNTRAEVDALAEALEKARKFFFG